MCVQNKKSSLYRLKIYHASGSGTSVYSWYTGPNGSEQFLCCKTLLLSYKPCHCVANHVIVPHTLPYFLINGLGKAPWLKGYLRAFLPKDGSMNIILANGRLYLPNQDIYA